jgi:hypothetical protein
MRRGGGKKRLNLLLLLELARGIEPPTGSLQNGDTRLLKSQGFEQPR